MTPDLFGVPVHLDDDAPRGAVYYRPSPAIIGRLDDGTPILHPDDVSRRFPCVVAHPDAWKKMKDTLT